MHDNELDRFIEDWDLEARKTVRLLESLPASQYDFRPWPEGRSLGELAWHLAEVEALTSWGIEKDELSATTKPPGIERPREVKALAPGYQRVHDESKARLKHLKPADLDRNMRAFGHMTTVRDLLWKSTLQHLIHHRGELVLMTRLADGTPPGLYGPNLEETQELRAKR